VTPPLLYQDSADTASQQRHTASSSTALPPPSYNSSGQHALGDGRDQCTSRSYKGAFLVLGRFWVPRECTRKRPAERVGEGALRAHASLPGSGLKWQWVAGVDIIYRSIYTHIYGSTPYIYIHRYTYIHTHACTHPHPHISLSLSLFPSPPPPALLALSLSVSLYIDRVSPRRRNR